MTMCPPWSTKVYSFQEIQPIDQPIQPACFVQRPGKGSHTVWAHPNILGLSLTISGKDGDDAHPYQVKDVRDALEMVGKIL